MRGADRLRGALPFAAGDDAHRRGGRYRVVSSDPRRAGRVCPGADGRGLFYGDPMEGK